MDKIANFAKKRLRSAHFGQKGLGDSHFGQKGLGAPHFEGKGLRRAHFGFALWIDLGFCLVVLPLMALIFPIERWFHHFAWYVAVVSIWLYAAYGLNRWLTVRYLVSSRTRWKGLMLILLSVGVTFGLTQVHLFTPKPSVFDAGIKRIFPNVTQIQQAVWSLFMIVEAFSIAVGLMKQTERQRARRLAVEAERDKAELELYKARIKPHFMFNTLNSLYGLFLTGSENALPSLEMYIDMMRYVSVSTRKDFVALSEDVDYIRRFVGLQSLRLTGRTRVELFTEIENEQAKVPPMLLVTFVENCFKHGVSPVESSTIEIRLREHSGKLMLSTSNRIFPVSDSSGGAGMANCRKRLQLIYPDAHWLRAGEENGWYHVSLKIDLRHPIEY